MRVTLTVNGTTHALDVDPGRTLADVLGRPITRPDEVCPDGACGACAVSADGDEVRSCLMPVVQAGGMRVTTTGRNAARRNQR